MEILHSPLHFFIFITLLSTAAELSKSADTITLSRQMSDNETLVSAVAKFELGFFSPRNSSNRYVGIWFYNILVKTIVGVVNRDDPINGSSGVLQIGRGGNPVIIDGTGRIVWSTNTVNVTYDNVAAQLLDSRNLGLPQKSLRKNASVVELSGPWDGIQVSRVLMIPNAIFNPQFVTIAPEVYYASQLINESTIMRIFLTHSSMLQCSLE
ncbi:hypothetical protein NL676_007836 [Syzygium grande]|nr:hypothetical protein NL676_007836 [Syzygium grande]